MNRSDLVEMAYQSGVVRRDVAAALVDTIMRVEREACAKVCAEDESGRDSGGYYAEIIRERGTQ